MSQREEYSKPRVEAITIEGLLAEVQRTMRLVVLEIEDLELVRESVNTRLAALEHSVGRVTELTASARLAVSKVNAIFEMQGEVADERCWHGNNDRPDPRFHRP